MIKKYVATALLGTALAGGAAFAQTTTPASPTPAPAASASVDQSSLKGTNWRGSKLVGLAVYNDSNEKLGDISEILLDKTGKINAVIIGVGGFLGVGQHDIAVSFDKLKWVDEPIRSASADKMPGSSGTATTARPSTTTGAAGGGMATTTTRNDWYPDHAVMSGTKDQLKAMPAFKYSESTSTK